MNQTKQSTYPFIKRLILLSWLVTPMAWAQTESEITTKDGLTDATTTIPSGCSNEGIRFQGGQLILDSQNPSVYLFHNHSDYQQLLLSHPTNTAMSAGWLSRLAQGQWSALVMAQTHFVINCFGRKPGVATYVDCQSVIDVCTYHPVSSYANGSYWLSENKSLFDTINVLKGNS